MRIINRILLVAMILLASVLTTTSLADNRTKVTGHHVITLYITAGHMAGGKVRITLNGKNVFKNPVKITGDVTVITDHSIQKLVRTGENTLKVILNGPANAKSTGSRQAMTLVMHIANVRNCGPLLRNNGGVANVIVTKKYGEKKKSVINKFRIGSQYYAACAHHIENPKLSKDQRVIEYMVCVAIKKHKYNKAQADWLRKKLLLIATRPSEKKVEEYNRKNPFPPGEAGRKARERMK